MTKVTDKMLENAVNQLNIAAGMPTQAYHGNNWNIGSYYIDKAYGGNKLVQVDNNTGGVRDVLNSGYVNKRECLELIWAYHAGHKT